MLRVVPLAAVLVALTWADPAPASALIEPDTSCRTGEVALTFDDGPHGVHTPKLLKVLREQHAQVTFFVQGKNAAKHRGLLREMVRDGHAVENHTWDHPQLTTIKSSKVKRQLTRTTAVIRSATGQEPRLFRPPYGDTDKRVKKVAAKLRLEQELWTIDSRDWDRLSRKKIVKRALKGLHPHRSNVVLLHDGVRNSGRTVAAVPSIVRELRRKGYCLRPLQDMMPLQTITGTDLSTSEPKDAESARVPIILTLDGPAQRKARVHVTSQDGTARAGVHFDRVDQWLDVPRGASSVMLWVRIRQVEDDHLDRTFDLVIEDVRALRIDPAGRRLTISVVDSSDVLDPAALLPTLPTPTPTDGPP